jgi:chloramphenicol O-acetyltransferase type B
MRTILRKVREFICLRQVGSHAGVIFVGGPTRLTRQTHLGKNSNFNGMKISGRGKVVIGDNFHSGQDCLMITSFHRYDDGNSLPYGDDYIDKCVVIGHNVWIGDRVIILGGSRIGDGAVIQAGSVVSKEIPTLGIAGGNPANVFKYRDRSHYEKLNAEKRYR